MNDELGLFRFALNFDEKEKRSRTAVGDNETDYSPRNARGIAERRVPKGVVRLYDGDNGETFSLLTVTSLTL